jgi:hypothetical protein
MDTDKDNNMGEDEETNLSLPGFFAAFAVFR